MHSQAIEIVHGRMNPHIDPALHIWGWDVALYLFLGGMSAGLLVLAAIMGMGEPRRISWAARLAPIWALAAISIGMFFLFLDLEMKLHVHRFYLAFKPASPMSWGAWILLITYPTGLLLALGGWSSSERDSLLESSWVGRFRARALLDRLMKLADERRGAILGVSLAVGVGLGIYTGLLLGTLAARIQWNTAILGPLFLTSGVSTGAALLLLLPISHQERERIARWDVGAITVELGLLAVMLIGLATAGRAAQHAAWNLMGGPYTGVFWSLVVIMGLVVPLILETIEMRRKLAPVLLAPVLVLIGGLALRFVLLYAGQETSFDAVLAAVGG